MIDSLDILLGVTGQLVYFDAPEGRPSSVTSVGVFEDDGDDTSTAEFTPTGTVETSPNTTFNAAAGPNEADPTKVPVAATTGVARNRRLLLTNAAGETEWIEVERFTSGSAIYARSPLMNTYASSDTVHGTRINATVDATWVAEANNLSVPSRVQPRYRIRWVYVAGGVTYAASTFFDLVRYPSRHSITGLDVDAYSAGWLDRLTVDDRRNQGERVIGEAFRQVKEDLRTRALADYGQRNSEFLNALVVRKAVYIGAHAAFMHGAVSAAFMDRGERDYHAYLDKTIDVTTTQATEDGAGAETPRAPIWVR